jgi:hypothetical protein
MQARLLNGGFGFLCVLHESYDHEIDQNALLCIVLDYLPREVEYYDLEVSLQVFPHITAKPPCPWQHTRLSLPQACLILTNLQTRPKISSPVREINNSPIFER